MGISVCIIAKNEQQNIARCLTSVIPFSNEIIVVDTGSTDDTVAIAESFGAKIFHYPWTNDFAAARNFSLAQASEEWILVIDCDEEVDADSQPLFPNLSHEPYGEGFGVSILNIIDNIPSYENVSPRFFKNLPHIRYKGTIHENLVDTRTNLPPQNSFLTSKLKLIHYGYDSDPILQSTKTKRNLDLLLAIPEVERDAMYYLHLGAEYIRLQDFTTASQVFEQGFDLADWTEPYFPSLAHKLVDSLFHNQKYIQAINYIILLLHTFPDFKCLYFLKGACHLSLNEYDKALQALETHQSLEHKPFKYPAIPFEEFNDIDNLIQKLRSRNGS